MRRDITYHWGEDTLFINLGNRIEPRIKILFWAEFIFTTGWATIFLVESFQVESGLLNTLGCLGSAFLYLLASYRFLSRMFHSEKLVLRTKTLDIVQRSPFFYRSRSFEWSFMGPLHYVGQDKKTKHPLHGNCYDYLGFETQEKLIHKLHNEGNLFFNYGGFPVRFGKGIYSWNAEEIVNIMKLFTGNKLVLGPEWAEMIQEHEVGDA